MTEEENLKALGQLHLRCMALERRVEALEENEDKVKEIMQHMVTVLRIGAVENILLLVLVIAFIVLSK